MDPKIREALNKIKDSAVEAGRTASRVANELIEQAKLNYRVMELNSTIEAAYKNIGRIIYEIHTGVDIPNERIDDELALVDGLNAELLEVREALKKAKAGKVCPECGGSIGKNDIYCPTCGSRVKHPDGGYAYSSDSAGEACGCEDDCCCETEAAPEACGCESDDCGCETKE